VKRPHKYRAVPTHLDGIRFPSKREAQRYGVLKMLEKAGEISWLQLQPSFPVLVNGVRVFTYKADFSYFDRTGIAVVEDVKGYKTPMYRLKKKCVKAQYGVEIKEV
jgi:hypothetical protein